MSMDIGMQGKRVVVTAGAQGIGLAITAAFVAVGAEVHICDVSDDFLASAKVDFPRVSQSRTDVADAAQPVEAARRPAAGRKRLFRRVDLRRRAAPVREADGDGPSARRGPALRDRRRP